MDNTTNVTVECPNAPSAEELEWHEDFFPQLGFWMEAVVSVAVGIAGVIGKSSGKILRSGG
jgi:hypothetical protein